MLLKIQDYTVGWICVLPVELAAAVGMLDEEHERLKINAQDTNTYSYGRIWQHNVVIACLPAGTPGTTPAATVANNMIRTFPNLRFGLLAGIGGGIPHVQAGAENDIRLGDVVVSIPQGQYGGVIQYDFGKNVHNKGFTQTGTLNRPPTTLGTAITTLQGKGMRRGYSFQMHIQKMVEENPLMAGQFELPDASHDVLFQSDYVHQEGQADCRNCCKKVLRPPRLYPGRPAVRYGLVGSANCVIQDPILRDKLGSDQYLLCLEMEAAGLMNDFPCIIIRGICDYCDTHANKIWQPYAAAVAAALTKELLECVTIAQVNEIPRVIEIMADIKIHTAIGRDTLATVKKIQHDIDLNILPCVDGAAYNWQSTSKNERCHPETRLELLQQITNWFDNPSAEPICWLNGMAGTGKTSVAREFAYRCADRGELAASFFFKRGEGDRSSSLKVCPTIAHQFAHKIPGYKEYLGEVLQQTYDVARLSFLDQFDKLIAKPLQVIKQDQRLLMVIDALDECADERDIKTMLYQLAQLDDSASLSLKIFVTGRPEPHIRSGFANIKRERLVFRLQDIPKTVNDRDIAVYITQRLSEIREEYNLDPIDGQELPSDWPGQLKLQGLVSRTSPLFIYAVTLCRVIEDKYTGYPNDNLDGILASLRDYGMESIYLPILERLVQGGRQEDRQRKTKLLNDTVGSIVLLFTSLSSIALAKLLGIDHDKILGLLHLLHSVLNIPADRDLPVQLLHLSFRDFLVDPERHGRDFWVNEQDTHRYLLRQCLNCLRTSGHLEQDICKVEDPSCHRQDIPLARIQECLPSHIQYACVYWLQHFERCSDYNLDMDLVMLFLKRHFLQWLEALCLLGRVSDTIIILNRISLSGRISSSSEPGEFLSDATKLILTFRTVISAYPLQIYSSVLISAPEASLVRRTFKEYIPEYVVDLPTLPQAWSSVYLKLEVAEVSMLTFTSDSRYLALVSSKGIQLWDLITGTRTMLISPGPDEVTKFDRNFRATSVAFSRSGALIAYGTHKGKINLYETVSGSKLLSLSASGRINSISFSYDERYLASATASLLSSVLLWEIDSSRLLHLPYMEDIIAKRVFFSLNDEFLAIGGSEGVALYSMSQENMIWVYRPAVMEMTQIQDANRIVFFPKPSSNMTRPYIFDINSKTLHLLPEFPLLKLENVHWENHIAISSIAHELLIAHNWHSGLTIWNLSTNLEIVYTPHGHQLAWNAVSFSNSGYLACATPREVCVWRPQDIGHIETGMSPGPKTPTIVALSPSGTQIAWVLPLLNALEVWSLYPLKLDFKIDLEPLIINRTYMDLAFSNKGSYLMLKLDSQMNIWRAESGDNLVRCDLPFSRSAVCVSSPLDDIVAISKRGYQSAIAYDYIEIWNISSRTRLSTLHGSTPARIDKMFFSPDGSTLAWIYTDDYSSEITDGFTIARLSDAQPRTFLKSMRVKSVCFRRDNQIIAAYVGQNIWVLDSFSDLVLESIYIPDANHFTIYSRGLMFDDCGAYIYIGFEMYWFAFSRCYEDTPQKHDIETLWKQHTEDSHWLIVDSKKRLLLPPGSFVESKWHNRKLAWIGDDKRLCLFDFGAGGNHSNAHLESHVDQAQS